MKILLAGYDGAMGSVFSSLYPVEAGFSAKCEQREFATYTSLDAIKEDIDVIVDFSHVSATDGILDFVEKHNIPLILATTNLKDSHHQRIDDLAKKIPILQTGNFSRGMNLMERLSEDISAVLADYDVEITESHHRNKKDAPSGSAEMLFDAVKRSRSEVKPVYDRSQVDAPRNLNDVGIHSLRGGNVVGEHEVSFFGDDEIVTIKHQALSKEIFAKGAYESARFILSKKQGRYDYKDVIFND